MVERIGKRAKKYKGKPPPGSTDVPAYKLLTYANAPIETREMTTNDDGFQRSGIKLSSLFISSLARDRRDLVRKSVVATDDQQAVATAVSDMRDAIALGKSIDGAPSKKRKRDDSGNSGSSRGRGGGSGRGGRDRGGNRLRPGGFDGSGLVLALPRIPRRRRRCQARRQRRDPGCGPRERLVRLRAGGGQRAENTQITVSRKWLVTGTTNIQP